MKTSDEIEKNETSHLEAVPSRTPPSELEKGQHGSQLAPVASRSPVIHEKVCTADMQKGRNRPNHHRR
jgi:hypothetical protein